MSGNKLSETMKTSFLILLGYLLSGYAFSQIPIDTFYTVFADGMIHFTNKNYNSDPGDYDDVTPYVFTSEVEYSSQGKAYKLEFFNYRGWKELQEPGFARVLDLYCNGTKLLQFIDEMGWSNKPIPLINSNASIRVDECLIFQQKNNVDVIILLGYPYESQPRVVVIAVQGLQAKVVSFTDQLFHIESITKDSDGYFEIKLFDDWFDPGYPRTPVEYIMKSTATGMYLYKN